MLGLMLELVALALFVLVSVKLSYALSSHASVMAKSEIEGAQFRALQMSPLLYIPTLIAFVLPVSWLAWLSPIPFGFLLLLPGIVLGKKYSAILERAGTDEAESAGRSASNIMWLGIAAAVFITAIVLISIGMEEWSKLPWE